MSKQIAEKPFNPVDLLSRLHWTEDYDLEFKSAKGGLLASRTCIKTVWVSTLAYRVSKQPRSLST